MSDGPDGFLTAVEAALAEKATGDASLSAARQALAKASSWRRRVADLEDLLSQLP